MAQIPGQRFDISLDDENVAPHEQAASEAGNATVPGFIGDILERDITRQVAPPSIKGHTSGFPEHKKRNGISKFKQSRSGVEPSTAGALKTETPDIAVSSPQTPADNNGQGFERAAIDAENKKTLAGMSDAEIQQEREELLAGLSPALIQKLLKRSNIDDEPQQKFEEPSKTNRKMSENNPRRPSNSERRVSFALPEEKIQETETTRTASSHSISSSPSPLWNTQFPGHESDGSEGLSRTTSNTSIASRQSLGMERKVSFVLPDYIEEARKASPTAVKHSISSPMTIVSDKVEPVETKDIPPVDLTKSPSHSAMKSPGRPSVHERKVSFALPEPDNLELERRSSSAVSHSIASSPSPNKIDEVDPLSKEPMEGIEYTPESLLNPPSEEGTVHFPKPPAAPELDPNSETFLEDMHKKYFPNLAHDPSKLAWMTPPTDEENASYDPARANLDPKDVRFDFKGAIIPPSKSATIPTDLGLHHHGDAPSAAGYTVAELGHLARSAFPAQRSIAMQTAGRILFRLGKGEFGDENDVGVEGPDGEKALLAKGLWDAVDQARVIDTITAEANKESGHQTSIALAQEAVWNWRKGGGRHRKAI